VTHNQPGSRRKSSLASWTANTTGAENRESSGERCQLREVDADKSGWREGINWGLPTYSDGERSDRNISFQSSNSAFPTA
jgi:hypothetical protein